MNLTLKNVKIVGPQSEETICFSAILLVEGKPTFHVSNDGKGGAHRYCEAKGFEGHFATALKELEDWAKTQPSQVIDFSEWGGGPIELPMDLDLFINNLL